ncbi:MAG: hypothetical protein IKY09_02595 [Methanocorpusculum sp.]|nr:hypothetical protein [Methanocorpusculum sp.]MBR5450202.1 hypothetical protein [Methanocorpusculum sp.]
MLGALLWGIGAGMALAEENEKAKVKSKDEQLTEAKEIISKLCFVIHEHEDDYNIRGLMQKAKAFLKE